MLDRVTITGADDQTPIGWMAEVSGRWPFVEWGVLVSKSHEGSPRYPSRAWIGELSQVAQGDNLMRLSMHVCGSWARLIFAGALDWTLLPQIRNYVQRVQVNGVPPEDIEPGVWDLRDRVKQFIFQHPTASGFADLCVARDVDAVRLFDLSGGRGATLRKWEDVADEYVGYAGAINPATVVEDVRTIMEFRQRRF